MGGLVPHMKMLPQKFQLVIGQLGIKAAENIQGIIKSRYLQRLQPQPCQLAG